MKGAGGCLTFPNLKLALLLYFGPERILHNNYVLFYFSEVIIIFVVIRFALIFSTYV